MVIYGCVCGSGMGGHGYAGQGDVYTGFHSGHFVHMRGLPFRAIEGDIAKVSPLTNVLLLVTSHGPLMNNGARFTAISRF